MRAVRISEFGGPEVLELVEVPTPEPPPGGLVVTVAAAGVNFRDVMMRRGLYPGLPSPPLPVGCEGAGTVVAVGDGVDEFGIGDRVAWAGTDGSYAEVAVIPAADAVRVPDGIDAGDAAALLSQGLTAHYLATTVWGEVRRGGGTALVLSAAGGVGGLLTQIIAATGGTVVAAVSDERKVPTARGNGAAEVVVGYENLATAAHDLTDGRGVDVVFDGVGGEGFADRLRGVRRCGLVVLYGASGGRVEPVDLNELAMAGSVFVTRPRLVDFLRDRDELLTRSRDLFSWLAAGTLRPHIHRRYGLDGAQQAHLDLESRSTTGKLVIHPNGNHW